MSYRNSTDYEGTYDSFLFVKNLQGDIIKVLDDEGNLLVSYTYDAWGNPTSTTYSNSGASTAVIYNPFRYRGYYYDSEIGLYYLNSRYYNPVIGRFINADTLVSTGQGILGYNMFAYCENTPINGCDPCGTCIHRWDFWNDCQKCGGKTAKDKINAVVNSCKAMYNIMDAYVNNTDPNVVYNGGFLTFYKGAPVLRLPFEMTGFSFGVIVLGSQYQNNKSGINTLMHEYGHVQQLKERGIIGYTAFIALPSIGGNLANRMDILPWEYYSSPWEYEADILGGVDRGNYETWASTVNSIIYEPLSKIAGAYITYSLIPVLCP